MPVEVFRKNCRGLPRGLSPKGTRSAVPKGACYNASSPQGIAKRNNLAIYFNYFEREGLPRSDLLHTASPYAAAIATQNGEYYRSMEGIAAGSNLSLAEIVALNIRYELIYQLFTTNMMAETPRADGSTAFAVLHSAPDDHLGTAQNKVILR